VCDTLVTVTADGVLFAKNSDRDPNEAQLLDWHPAADHPGGSEVTCTWVAVPQVPHTHAVLLSRPWWMWGAEMGANEHGVVIGNEAVFTRGPADEPALLGMDHLRLALERAATAEAAVGVLVDLLERHGQGGPCSRDRPGFTYDNSYLVADPTGAVVVETSGRDWATEVVRGPGRSISNGLSIPAFARTHSRRARTWVAAATRRRSATEPLVGAVRGAHDLMTALRSHGPGGRPHWSRVHGGLTAPCVHAGGQLASSQTTGSWVSDLRHGARHWATGTAAPCTSLFLPVDVAGPVDLGPDPTDRFDPSTRWWRHELLHRTVLAAYDGRMASYAGERDAVEAAWVADRPLPADAAAEADVLGSRWLAAARAVDGRDPRPSWVRRRWADADRAAGIDGALAPGPTPGPAPS
jgi:secernin